MKIALRYVVVDTSRHGQDRRYYRDPISKAKIRLWPSVDDPLFLMHYEDARKGIAHDKPRAADAVSVVALDRARPNSFRWLCEAYMSSGDFRRLAATSRARQRGIFESCWKEETRPGSGLPIGDMPLPQFTPGIVRILRDRKADLPGAANNRIKYLRRLFSWAEADRPSLGNPAKKIPPFKTRSTGFHPWSPEEVRVFEAHHPVGTAPRVALDVLLYTCVRRGDAVRLGPAMVTDDGWLDFRQGKNNGQVEIPILAVLARSLAAGPTGATTWIARDDGKPRKDTSFGNWFRDQCDAAGLPQCSAHGVRKATSARLAELGCSEEEIQAVTGHSDPKQIRTYTRSARKRIMAASAMAKLEASLILKLKSPT